MEVQILRRQGHSLREIAVQTGIAINTVRKHLESGPPQRRRREPKPSKLSAYHGYLQERVASARPQWIPATVLLREIREQGYPGGLRMLQAYLRTLRPAARPDPVVRFETAPGQQMQVDWIEFRKPGHAEGMLAAFVATLGYSRASFVEFVTDMRLETLLACHQRAFDCFGGVPREVLYDNMKTVILKRDAYDKGQHQYQPTFADFARHYGFAPRVCQPYRAKTKGKVERMNGYLRYSFWVPLASQRRHDRLPVDGASCNLAVKRWLREVANARVHATTQCVPAEALIEERPHLQPLPPVWLGTTVRTVAPPQDAAKPVSRHAQPDWDIPLQRSLARYDVLGHLPVPASEGGHP
ncbi:IS21 family transposase [Chitinimonas sp. DQS-5]|uniref:IS21 family transposase n=2 Tax=Parachitinimonas caeni TaxID=3031301 RepID=A0ABT7E3S3_9NEIS|nr:IS21 family transposase [Parachitinimonas caeni]MDK2126966.1 IS21 family transposase [Parachitinimonas caeni]